MEKEKLTFRIGIDDPHVRPDRHQFFRTQTEIVPGPLNWCVGVHVRDPTAEKDSLADASRDVLRLLDEVGRRWGRFKIGVQVAVVVPWSRY